MGSSTWKMDSVSWGKHGGRGSAWEPWWCYSHRHQWRGLRQWRWGVDSSHILERVGPHLLKADSPIWKPGFFLCNTQVGCFLQTSAPRASGGVWGEALWASPSLAACSSTQSVRWFCRGVVGRGQPRDSWLSRAWPILSYCGVAIT